MSIQIPTRALAALALCTAAPAHATDPITALPFETLDWSGTPEGVAFAPLLGDRFAEPYMAMVRLPAGTVSPAHVKSANMFGIMLQGTMTHVAANADPSAAVALSQGAFYMVPAGLAHVSSCISDSACVTFLSQDGTFDFLPVSP
ncbi:MAG TPA: hypothetical protein DIU07_09245 [Rhodobacteraceae bacterium]|nr:hypothetical protein [Paracoccaceae bacterium]